MNPLELAGRYMEIVFGAKEPEELAAILAPGMKFTGPMFAFSSARDYIRSLKESPPDGFGFRHVASFQDEDSACVVYQFTKPGISTPMAQLFRTAQGKITEILLVFDTAPFISKG